MEIEFSKGAISFKKTFNDLDKFAFDFCDLLNKLEVNYTVISGYVSILFGRNRTSEDIDLFIEKVNFIKFIKIWKLLNLEFECINTSEIKEAFDGYINCGHSLRFARKGKFIPNIEIKFPKDELDEWTLENRVKIIVNNSSLFIGPLELQIPFKLTLGTEKDIEDARFLYKLFKNNLKIDLLEEFNRRFKIEGLFNKYILK